MRFLIGLLDQTARLNAYLTLITLQLVKPIFRYSVDLTYMVEIKEITCREIIVNGHPLFRNRRK